MSDKPAAPTSDTPLTDAFSTAMYNDSMAAAADIPGYSGRDISPEEAYVEAITFARKLERDLAAERKAHTEAASFAVSVDHINSGLLADVEALQEELAGERAKREAENERLREPNS